MNKEKSGGVSVWRFPIDSSDTRLFVVVCSVLVHQAHFGERSNEKLLQRSATPINISIKKCT